MEGAGRDWFQNGTVYYTQLHLSPRIRPLRSHICKSLSSCVFAPFAFLPPIDICGVIGNFSHIIVPSYSLPHLELTSACTKYGRSSEESSLHRPTTPCGAYFHTFLKWQATVSQISTHLIIDLFPIYPSPVLEPMNDCSTCTPQARIL